jgi:hypothetical protein
LPALWRTGRRRGEWRNESGLTRSPIEGGGPAAVRTPAVNACTDRTVRESELVLVRIVATIGFTVSLFFATAAFPEGAALSETKMGALMSFVAAPLQLFAARILRVRAANLLG